MNQDFDESRPRLLGTTVTSAGTGSEATSLDDIVSKVTAHNVVLDLPESTLMAIGTVITYHSVLEWALVGIVCELAGTDRKIGRIALGAPRAEDAHRRICQLCLVHGIKPPDSLPDANALRKLKEKRDLIAHGIFFEDQQSKVLCVQETTGHWAGLSGVPQSVPKRIYPAAQEVPGTWFFSIVQEIKSCIAASDVALQAIRASLSSTKGKA